MEKENNFGNVRFRGRNTHSLRVIASNFVCNVLGVDEEDPSYNNTRCLLYKAINVSISTSNINIINNFISRHGTREEQSRVPCLDIKLLIILIFDVEILTLIALFSKHLVLL